MSDKLSCSPNWNLNRELAVLNSIIWEFSKWIQVNTRQHIHNIVRSCGLLGDGNMKNNTEQPNINMENIESSLNLMYKAIIEGEIRRRESLKLISTKTIDSIKSMNKLQAVKYLAEMNKRDNLIEEMVAWEYINSDKASKLRTSNEKPEETIIWLNNLKFKKDELARRKKDETLTPNDIADLSSTRDSDAVTYLKQLASAEKQIEDKVKSWAFTKDRADSLKYLSYMDRITYMEQVSLNDKRLERLKWQNLILASDEKFFNDNTDPFQIDSYLKGIEFINDNWSIALSHKLIANATLKSYRKDPIKWARNLRNAMAWANIQVADVFSKK